MLEKWYRAVLAAASPSLLGPSLLQEGSEAEDMVSVTVPITVIVMTVIMIRMIMITPGVDFENEKTTRISILHINYSLCGVNIMLG